MVFKLFPTFGGGSGGRHFSRRRGFRLTRGWRLHKGSSVPGFTADTFKLSDWLRPYAVVHVCGIAFLNKIPFVRLILEFDAWQLICPLRLRIPDTMESTRRKPLS